MSRIAACLAAALIIAALGISGARERRWQARLTEESGTVRQLRSQTARLTSDNQALSNSVNQFRRAQAEANQQFQELVRVRAELVQMKQQQSSNAISQESAVAQAEELTRLRQELALMRDHSEQRQARREEKREGAATEVATNEQANAPSEEPEQPLSLRVIRTEGAPFAEKLKRSVNAQDEETFQEVFGRFLQFNGVPTNAVAAAVYDERTGRVIVRAPQSTLDQIEQLTMALDRAP